MINWWPISLLKSIECKCLETNVDVASLNTVGGFEKTGYKYGVL